MLYCHLEYTSKASQQSEASKIFPYFCMKSINTPEALAMASQLQLDMDAWAKDSQGTGVAKD